MLFSSTQLYCVQDSPTNPNILQNASNKTETTLIRIESAAVHALAPAIQAVSYLLAPRTPSSPGDADVLEPAHVSRAPAPAPQSALAMMQVCFLGAWSTNVPLVYAMVLSA